MINDPRVLRFERLISNIWLAMLYMGNTVAMNTSLTIATPIFHPLTSLPCHQRRSLSLSLSSHRAPTILSSLQPTSLIIIRTAGKCAAANPVTTLSCRLYATANASRTTACNCGGKVLICAVESRSRLSWSVVRTGGERCVFR